jgi:hypothetical protein
VRPDDALWHPRCSAGVHDAGDVGFGDRIIRRVPPSRSTGKGEEVGGARRRAQGEHVLEAGPPFEVRHVLLEVLGLEHQGPDLGILADEPVVFQRTESMECAGPGADELSGDRREPGLGTVLAQDRDARPLADSALRQDARHSEDRLGRISIRDPAVPGHEGGRVRAS